MLCCPLTAHRLLLPVACIVRPSFDFLLGHDTMVFCSSPAPRPDDSTVTANHQTDVVVGATLSPARPSTTRAGNGSRAVTGQTATSRWEVPHQTTNRFRRRRPHRRPACDVRQEPMWSLGGAGPTKLANAGPDAFSLFRRPTTPRTGKIPLQVAAGPTGTAVRATALALPPPPPPRLGPSPQP